MLKGSIYGVNLYFYHVYRAFSIFKVLFSVITMAEHNLLGTKGEDLAVEYLKDKGHHVIERNWRFSGYEIDVISEDEEFIVFVEVKTRSSSHWGNPEDAIGKHRMRRMINGASNYLKLNSIDKPARFDIVAIVVSEGEKEIEHFEDAFLAFL